MKRVRTIFHLAAAVLGAGLLTGCGSQDAGNGFPVDGKPTVEILIDSMGVPHIYGRTDEDAFYGAGYQMAVDRLYQMETLRRFALGRLAEVVGEAGLERDIQARIFDFPRWGRADLELMRPEDPERVRLIAAWVRGINRRVEEVRTGRAPLPFGYGPEAYDFLPEPWDEADPYIVLKGANFALDKTIEFEVAVTLLATFFPKAFGAVEIFKPAHPVYGMPPEDRPQADTGPSLPRTLGHGGGYRGVDGDRAGAWGVETRAGSGGFSGAGEDAIRASLAALSRWGRALPGPAGSNNWAVDGRHTRTGLPLIAGDPHLSFDFFGAPYPMHINSADAGGTYNVAGFAYPGTPGIALGHNDRVVWTATSAFADVNDIWRILRLGDSVLVGRSLVPVTKRQEEIIVREPGMPAGQGRIETRVYEEVEGRGVIIPQEVIGIPLAGPYLMAWTGFTARPARWFMELNRVASLDAFEEAVDRMREMNYSFVAADASGIAYRVGVDVPLREGIDGRRAPWKAMDSWDEGGLWTGRMLAREQLPRSRAPQRGWLATANNDPFGFTGDGRLDNDPWFYGALFDPGYRARRIEDELVRLTRRGDVAVEDMQAMQRDIHSTLADDLLPLLGEARRNAEADPDLARFMGLPDLDRVVTLLTAEWDRRMARDSAGALAFHAFLHFLSSETLRDDISLAYDFAVSLQAVFVIKVAAMAVAGAYPDGDAVVQGGRDLVLLTAALRTAEWLKRSFGTTDPAAYAYADRKETLFDDAFGFGMPVFSRPTDGGEDTLNVSQNIVFSETAETWTSSYVAVERSVGTFAPDGTPEVHVNFPVGAHADPASPDTISANSDYIEGRYRKLFFRRAEIEADARERILLEVR